MNRKLLLSFFCFLLLTLLSTISKATTYNVGPTRTYTTIQSVVGLLAPGDLVLVDGNATYGSTVTLNISGTAIAPITIRGVRVNGNRPLLSGGIGNFGFNIIADNYIIEGFEISGKAKTGIGCYADNITVRDCVIHNCDMGLMGYGTGTGNVTLEYSEFYSNGNGGSSHQVYMATDEFAHPTAVFRMQFCYMHNGVGGNGVKSRAGRNEIYYNWIEGSFYHGLELIGFDGEDNENVTESMVREDSDVVGNVVIASNGFACARVGGDRSDAQTLGRYRFVNNTFIISSGGGSVVRIAETIQTIEMHNNVVYSKGAPASTRFLDEAGAWTAAGRQVKAINNWIQTGTDRLPPELTGTIFGTNPGFIDINSNNLRLVTGSPLINVAATAPATIAAYPFPNLLNPPVYHPSMHILQVSPAEQRPSVGTIDIGAYEFGSGSSCVSTITPTQASYTASAGTGSVSVTIGSACTWTASSNDSWITITSGANSTGNATVNYSVAANSTGARTGTLTIASTTVTISQAASGSCTYSVSPLNAAFSSSGGNGYAAVTSGCSWTASSNSPWITINTGAVGSGNGSVTYTVAANGSASSLTGTLTIAGQTFTVTQSGLASGCTNIGSSWISNSFTSQSGSFTAQFDATPSASATNDVIGLSSGAQSAFSGLACIALFDVDGKIKARNGSSYPASTISYTGGVSYHFRFVVDIAAHTYSIFVTPSGGSELTVGSNYAFRTEQNTVPQLNYWNAFVNTAGGASGSLQVCNFTLGTPACTYSLSSSSASVAATSSTGNTVAVTVTGSGCSWTASSNASWLTFTSGTSGTVTGNVTYSVASNSGAARSGTLTIAGQTFTVNQAAAACTYTLSSSSASVAATSNTGNTVTVTVTGSSCSWTASSNAAWLTVTGGASGTVTGNVTYSVASNSGAARSGTLTIAGQTFTVNQAAAAACTYALSSSSASVAATSSTGNTVTVTVTGSGCSWTATNNAAWLTVTAGASGTVTGNVTYSVAANSGIARSGTLTIAGQTFTVNQAASACTYTLSSSSASVAATSSTGNTVTVTVTGSSCSWTASSNAAWLTITGGASGTVTGNVTYSVAANSGASRSGTLTIAGQTFTVNQAAVASGSLTDLYIDELTPTISLIPGTGQVGTGTAVTVATGGVNNSAYMRFGGLTTWGKTKRLHFTTAKDISAVPSTASLRISVDITSNTNGTGIGIHFNDRWDVVVYSPNADNIAGFQSFDIPISDIRAALGNTVNDIYFEASNGFPSGMTLKIDNIQFVAAGTPSGRLKTSTDPVSISKEEISFSEEVNIYPNPANHEVNIVLNNPIQELAPLRLINSFGRIISEGVLEKGTKSKVINTQEYAPGVYIIDIQTTKGIIRKRLIVVH